MFRISRNKRISQKPWTSRGIKDYRYIISKILRVFKYSDLLRIEGKSGIIRISR